jgi:type II secretory pathway pseudopilin PulG
MKSNKGSALLVAILLSAILLAALAGLLTVALNEYRGSLKSYFNTAAFSLAESGVDRAAAAIVDKFSSATTLATGDAWPTAESVSTPTWYKKTSSGKTLYRGYFPAENLDKGRKGVCSVLCIEKSTTSYEVYTHGTVRGGEAGKGIEAQRAIKVEFTAKNGTGTPAYGCVSLGEFISSSTGD